MVGLTRSNAIVQVGSLIAGGELVINYVDTSIAETWTTVKKQCAGCERTAARLRSALCLAVSIAARPSTICFQGSYRLT